MYIDYSLWISFQHFCLTQFACLSIFSHLDPRWNSSFPYEKWIAKKNECIYNGRAKVNNEKRKKINWKKKAHLIRYTHVRHSKLPLLIIWYCILIFVVVSSSWCFSTGFASQFTNARMHIHIYTNNLCEINSIKIYTK